MITLIVSIIFILSLGGIAFIIYRKIPALKELPVNGKIEFIKPKIFSSFENRFKKFSSNFRQHIFLHKILFSVKCIISKTEHGIDKWLHYLRKKAQQKSKK